MANKNKEGLPSVPEISPAKLFLEESRTIPMGDILVDTFCQLTNNDSWEMGMHPSIPFLSGIVERLNDPNKYSIALQRYPEG